MENLDNLWAETLATIEKEISRANFLTLFKATALLSLEDGIATIAVPSTMIIDLIQKRYQTLIATTLKKLTEKQVDVLFVTRTVTTTLGLQTKDAPLFNNEPTTQHAKPLILGHLPRVRSEYTFQTMAVSSSNQLAFIAATNVSQNLGKSYNPLFIYGPVGVGKTHLMQAIANDAYQKDPSRKIIYITSEEFTNEVVEAIRTNQTHAMKKRFRSCALLIIDDVQFIAGKEKVQEELFHTFNILIDNSCQIILSSDRPPNEIKKLEKRLSSRFLGGLSVDVESPDFELRTAIVLIKAKKYHIELPIDVAKIIAEKVQDARSLEGQLLRLITEANAKGGEITLETAQKSLNQKGDDQNNNRFHPDDIIQKVCVFYNVKTTQVKGPKRDASLVRARQTAMYLLKTNLGLTYVEIGNILGGRDHTTIMYGVEKVEKNASSKLAEFEEILGKKLTLGG